VAEPSRSPTGAPDKAAQKDMDARWILKINRQDQLDAVATLPQMALPLFGYMSRAGIGNGPTCPGGVVTSKPIGSPLNGIDFSNRNRYGYSINRMEFCI